MYTIALCLTLTSICCLYALSDQVAFEKKGITLVLKTKKTLSRSLAAVAFLLSTYMLTTQMGLAVGIFASISLWMTLACLVILFVPFKVIKWPQLALAILVVASIEMSVLLV